MFKIDGTEYNMLCSIEREAEVTASELSGMLLDRTYFNDVIATYMRYTITIAVPVGEELNYATLYETLIDAVSDHEVEVPYNQTTLTIKGRIETVADKYVREEGSGANRRKLWRGTSFVITSNTPIKVGTL